MWVVSYFRSLRSCQIKQELKENKEYIQFFSFITFLFLIHNNAEDLVLLPSVITIQPRATGDLLEGVVVVGLVH